MVLAFVLGGITFLGLGAVGVLYAVYQGDRTVLVTTESDASLPIVAIDGYRFHAETYDDPSPRRLSYCTEARVATIVGHNWGAMLASVYIDRYPERVSRAVLAEPGFLDHEHMAIWNERTGLVNMRPTGSMIRAKTGV